MVIKLYATSLLLLLSSCTTYDTGFGTRSSSNVDMDDVRAYASSFPPYPKAGTPSSIYSNGYSNTRSEADLFRLVGACHAYSSPPTETTIKSQEVASLAINITIDFMLMEKTLPRNASDAEIDAAFREFHSIPPGSYAQNTRVETTLNLRKYFRNLWRPPINKWQKDMENGQWDRVDADPRYKIWATETDSMRAYGEREVEFCHSFLKKLRD